jgi:site-specific recombinase XerD
MSAGNRTRGERMTSRGIRERMNAYLTVAGVKNGASRRITALSLRQTAIRSMVERGASVREIQEMFRIKKDSTVEVYQTEILRQGRTLQKQNQ